MLPLRISRTKSRSYATAVSASTSNGYKLLASNTGQATTSLSIVLKAGTRYETKPGLATLLRGFAFKNNTQRSALATTREAELYGGILSSSLTRESVVLTTDFLKGDEDFFASVLSATLSTKYTPHELAEDILPSINAAGAEGMTSEVKALEAAHSIAFRSGLAKPLYPDLGHTGVVASDVKEYAARVFGNGEVTIVGTGISDEALRQLVDKHFPPLPAPSSASVSDVKTSYYGGESRIASGSGSGTQTVFIGYAVPTALSSSPELALLHSHLTSEPSTKWGTGTSPLSSVSSSSSIKSQTVLLPYSDATLFGVLLSSPSPGASEELKKAASHVVSALKSLASGGEGMKKEDLAKACAKAKFGMASWGETRDGVVNSLSAASLESHFSSLEKVTPSALGKFTTNLLKGKATYIGVGDVGSLPWGDEIGL